MPTVSPSPSGPDSGRSTRSGSKAKNLKVFRAMRTPTTSRPLTPTVSATTQSQDLVRLGVLASSPAHYHAPLYLRERFGRRSLEIIEDWNVEAAAQGLVDAVAAAVGPVRWARAQVRA